jgi:hypothetical protein
VNLSIEYRIRWAIARVFYRAAEKVLGVADRLNPAGMRGQGRSWFK